MSGRPTLVTGATGFVGRHVVDRLLELDRPVAVLVRPDRQLPAAWRGRVVAIECADWSEMGLHRALAPVPFYCVFHLAAYGVAPTARDVEQTLRINVAVAAALVRLSAERAARVVMAGTFSEYRRPAAAMPFLLGPVTVPGLAVDGRPAVRPRPVAVGLGLRPYVLGRAGLVEHHRGLGRGVGQHLRAARGAVGALEQAQVAVAPV